MDCTAKRDIIGIGISKSLIYCVEKYFKKNIILKKTVKFVKEFDSFFVKIYLQILQLKICVEIMLESPLEIVDEII